MSQQEKYYNRFWKSGKHGAKNQGYFESMKVWMSQQFEILSYNLDVFEAGCGSASFSPYLQRFSRSFVATDVSKQQLQKNAKAYPTIRFKYADLQENLPFDNNSFDVVWCSEVLEHLYFPHIALKEFRRVLRPGGRLLATVPFHGVLKNVLIALFKFEEHYDPYYPHVRFFTECSLRDMLLKTGYSSIQVDTCGLGKPIRDMFVKTNLLVNAAT